MEQEGLEDSMYSGHRGRWVGWLAISLIIGLFVTASAAEIHVPDDYRTIEEAVRNADRDDTIVVEDRFIIRDSITLRNERRLTIEGEFRFRRNTVIQGRRDTEPVIELLNCSDITFKNLTIQSGSVGISATNSRNIEIVECVIQDNAGSGLVGYDFIFCNIYRF